jgi:pSer/pThr/pTyr-binding forkhead associated (FHA) protein
MTISAAALEVIGGQDHGARLRVDEAVRTVGRARDADLVLRDVGVSRRHLQVVRTERGVSLAVCPNAAPFIVDGRPVRSFEAKPGDRVLVGNTVLVVVVDAEGGELPHDDAINTNVVTLLTGVGADVRGLAAVHALIESLDSAEDASSLEAAFRAWASEHASASSAELQREADDRSGSSLVEERPRGAVTTLVVPAPGADPPRLAVSIALPPGKITDSLRRMLVVAGRVFGSAHSRSRQLNVANGEANALRTLSVGSARAFLGVSVRARQLAALIPRLGASDASVLVEGETGVGKTFVARLIHEAGARVREPLRIINCAAISRVPRRKRALWS